MGHTAQYRKRFSDNTGSVYPLPPPSPAEWEVQWNGSNIRVRFVVVTPAPATGMSTSYQLSDGSWTPGLGGSVKDAWFAIEAESPSGNYFVRVRWAVVVEAFRPVSDWSDPKPITIP